MKPDKLLIIFFLLSIGVLVVGAKALSYHRAFEARAVANYNELFTDSYVRDAVLNTDGQFHENEPTYTFLNKRHIAPVDELRRIAQLPDRSFSVLGDTTEPKKIVVDLEHQRVYGYEGGRVVFNFLVSTGKWGPTPVGQYHIWYKVRSQTMKGGDRALGTYYYLPNVQFVQYFDRGISFHSTYWHNNFGHPMSHGCVNMTLTDAETLYYWANPIMPPGIRIFRSNAANPGTEVNVVASWKV